MNKTLPIILIIVLVFLSGCTIPQQSITNDNDNQDQQLIENNETETSADDEIPSGSYGTWYEYKYYNCTKIDEGINQDDMSYYVTVRNDENISGVFSINFYKKHTDPMTYDNHSYNIRPFETHTFTSKSGWVEQGIVEGTDSDGFKTEIVVIYETPYYFVRPIKEIIEHRI